MILTYDKAGRKLTMSDPDMGFWRYSYDPLGNMLTASRGGAIVTLTYDKAGRKKTMDDPDMGFWQYSYNALGGMTRQVDAKHQVTCLYYDELNRPRGKDYFTNSAACPSDPGSGYEVTYNYDSTANGNLGKGRRTSMSISGADYTQWIYDARGRVVSENKQITGGGQFITAFTYNAADLPVTMTYPDGEVVTFEYNNNMLPVSVSGTDTYAQTIAYDSANRMIQMIRGANKINTVFTYNNWNVDNGRLQNITSTQVSTGDPLQNLTYDYDSVGNIEIIVDSLSGPQTQAFTYDALDRLTNSSVTGGTDGLYTEGYTYEDPNNPNTGNLFSKNGVTYTYSTTHKHAVTSLSNGNTYGYDQNGNMTSRHVFEGTQFKDYTLNYDAENRLVSVTGAATASFVYDGDGKQVKATVNGITAVYVGNHYEVKNGVVTKFYFAGSTRLAVRTDGTLRFLLSDHLGSSSVTTNANGAKTASALYKAFGETRYTLGNLNTDYKFTGQREEASLGIYFFQARWFDPSLGRFLSPDTIVPTSTQGTQAWDRYAFVNNNPVRYNDPTGHEAGDMCDRGYVDDCDEAETLETYTLETYTLAGIETVSPHGLNYRPSLLTPLIFDSYGRAKLYPDEIEALGMDPQTPEGAFFGMQKRIDDRMKACTGCSDTDKFIVAALGSDYNFDFGHIKQATKKLYAAEPGGPNTINWEYYLSNESGALRKKFGDLLSSFTSNVLDLQSQGYYVPNGVDFDYINALLLTIP